MNGLYEKNDDLFNHRSYYTNHKTGWMICFLQSKEQWAICRENKYETLESLAYVESIASNPGKIEQYWTVIGRFSQNIDPDVKVR